MAHKLEEFLSLAGLFILLSLAAATSHVCEGDERPHPRGLCGRRLAQAHSNLCYILREIQPEIYGRVVRARRSSPRLQAAADGLVNRIYSIPLDVLAELDLNKDDWQLLLAKRSGQVHTGLSLEDFPSYLAAPRTDLPERKLYRHGTSALTRRVLRTLLRHGEAAAQDSAAGGSGSIAKQLLSAEETSSGEVGRAKRTAGNNMVCDCCYNRCTPEELGTYC